MDLQDNVERIVEDRKAEAIKKDLTKKIRTIVSTLGFEVKASGGITEGGFGHVESEFPEDWEWELSGDAEEEGEIEGMPVADLDSVTYTNSMYFDALSSGYNLQVWHRDSDELLKVTYDGFLVYRELKGQLDTYLPSPQWEDKLEILYRIAKKKAKMQEKDRKEAQDEKSQSRMQRILDYLRQHWGV